MISQHMVADLQSFLWVGANANALYTMNNILEAATCKNGHCTALSLILRFYSLFAFHLLGSAECAVGHTGRHPLITLNMYIK